MIRRKPNPRIVTTDRDRRPNGFLVPIYNVHDGFVSREQQPQQAYLTVVAPRSTKGPHLHMRRWGLFTCVSGNVRIVVREEERYEHYYSGELYDYQTIQVPAGLPAALVNDWDEPAFVLNLPSPAWQQDDQDDHPVKFDEHALRPQPQGK